MKLYDFALAPSPRRVRIFLAEKGVHLDVEQVPIRDGAQFDPAFRAMNPNCTVPVLQLDDGSCLTDSVAICRFFEEIQPDPPLFGHTPFERAMVELWHRRVELEGYQAVAETLRNSNERFKDRALPGPHSVAQIPALVERGQQRIDAFYDTLNERLKESPYVASKDFSIADIAALVSVDFASNAVEKRPAEGLTALQAWHQKVSARPSAAA